MTVIEEIGGWTYLIVMLLSWVLLFEGYWFAGAIIIIIFIDELIFRSLKGLFFK